MTLQLHFQSKLGFFNPNSKALVISGVCEISKNLWYDYSSVYSTPAQRSSMTGLAFIGQACTKNRYSIVHENGGFRSTRVSLFSANTQIDVSRNFPAVWVTYFF
jgi:hypothetical protein